MTDLPMEPEITINGVRLTQAQAMTVRVAIGSFGIALHANGLGTDQIGKDIASGYLRCIRDLNLLMRTR